MKLDKEHQMFKDTLRDFLEDEIAPDVKEMDKESMSKQEAIDYLTKLGELGLGPASDTGLTESFSDPMMYVISSEEISRVWVSLNVVLGMSFPVAFLEYTADVTQEAYADRIETGELIGCLAVTEPSSGSDTSRPETTATLDGDEYVINGEKTWVSNATIADVAMVVAWDEAEEQQDFFLVDQETADFEAEEFDKLGWKGSPTGQMFFDDCRIPAENKLSTLMFRIMEEEDDLSGTPLREDGILAQEKPLNAIFAFMRTGMAAMSVGICQAALDAALDYAKDRETFGKPIGQHQLIQEKLYDIKCATETARHLTYHAAELVNEADPEARMMSSLAKGYATEKSVDAASDAIQIYGGNGLSKDYPLERYFRDARMMTIPDGTTEIQKLIVGYEMTDLQAYE